MVEIMDVGYGKFVRVPVKYEPGPMYGQPAPEHVVPAYIRNFLTSIYPGAGQAGYPSPSDIAYLLSFARDTRSYEKELAQYDAKCWMVNGSEVTFSFATEKAFTYFVMKFS